MMPTVPTPDALRPNSHEAAIPAPTTNSGAGECGLIRSMASSPNSATTAMANVISDVSGTMMHHAQDVPEKALLGDVDAEQLRDLIEHDDQPDAGLEAGQHRASR